MKKNLPILALLVFICLSFRLSAQDCVDSTLINPNAICPLIYAPVCGCNGVTYDNNCLATNLGGVTSWTDGPCAQTNCLDLEGINFGPCDLFLGYANVGGTCAGLSGCGYTSGNVDYTNNFFTTLGECAASCGDVNCINQWQLDAGLTVDCISLWNPVCGCNSVTYSNECDAFFYGGVSTMSLGDCSGFLQYCPRIPSMVDFGECLTPLGWALTTGGCVEKSGCSYIGNNGYDYSDYFFESSYQCGNQCLDVIVVGIDCIDSTLIDPSMLCAQVIDPVCGCDSLTYNNECEAVNWYGVTTFTQGACTTSIEKEISGNRAIKIYPNPASDLLNIQKLTNGYGWAGIYDATGKMMSELIRMNQSTSTIDINDLPTGLYFVRYTSIGGENDVLPFIKN
jgi:hypothetical protein